MDAATITEPAPRTVALRRRIKRRPFRLATALEDVGWLVFLVLLLPAMILLVGVPIAWLIRGLLALVRLFL